MKKILAFVLTLAMWCPCMASLCLAEAAADADGNATATYTIYNVTGEKITELYAGDALTGEMGDNLAGEEGIEPDATVEIVKTVPADQTDKEHFVIDLKFVTESGYTGEFATLHFETVPISLLAQADVTSGATQIAFAAPEVTATYTIYNVTGEKITELYAGDALTGEMGDNLVGEEGLAPDATLEIVKTVTADQTDKEHFVIDLKFVTESGYTGEFATLHFETVPISLLAQADVPSGATQIAFAAPEAK